MSESLIASRNAWGERVAEIVNEAHSENLGGKHGMGFCEACADALLVAQVACGPYPTEDDHA